MNPIYDLATLVAVHDYYEFDATTEHQMDHWLHEQILRARKGRDLTAEEKAVHLGGFDLAPVTGETT